MVTSPATEFVQLDDVEARAFLARQHIGRVAYSLHDRVDIEPISYTFDRGWILGRTSVGAKLSTLAHHPWCAFEVDVVAGPFDWTSVVVKGTFYLLDPVKGSPDVYERALACAKALVADAFTPADPAPHRGILFGIFASEVTGRAARTITP